MNCLAFRRILLENPAESSDEFMNHLAKCKSCANEYQRAQQFEATLKEAMLIDAPDDLSERIILAQQFEKTKTSSNKRWYALAASILLATIALLVTLQTPHINNELGQTALNHVLDELPHLHDMKNISDQQLATLFHSMGAELNGSLGQVNYAGKCQIRKHAGIHLVLAGEKGAVTVLLMPQEYSEAKHIRNNRFEGSLVPTAFGSMAIIGEHGENTEVISDRVSHVLSWQA